MKTHEKLLESMTEILNERVKIFLAKHNLPDEAFTSIGVRLDYMRWINRCADKFFYEHKTRAVNNQDAFTEYLKNSKQAEQKANNDENRT